MALPDYRLAPLTEDRLDPEQRRFWDELRSGQRGATAVRDEGFLVGPFDVLARTPEVASAAARLGELLRYETDLSQRHRELTIIVVAAHWRASFAWLRHDVYATRAGLSQQAVAAIAAGEEPRFDHDDDQTVYAFVHELVHTGRVSDPSYQAALTVLGERSLVELTALAGYYCLSSLLLNAFAVPLPEGATVPWPVPGPDREESS
jgi:4-carboxymuconolactone decarboxylase